MKRMFVMFVSGMFLSACSTVVDFPAETGLTDMNFPRLVTVWDEGIPLGNGTVGGQRDSMLRFSLDRVDLWNLRLLDGIPGTNNRFSWMYEQVEKGDYLSMQKKFVHPYDRIPAPLKIPGAAWNLL